MTSTPFNFKNVYENFLFTKASQNKVKVVKSKINNSERNSVRKQLRVINSCKKTISKKISGIVIQTRRTQDNNKIRKEIKLNKQKFKRLNCYNFSF